MTAPLGQFFEKKQWSVIDIHQLYEIRNLPAPEKITWLGSLAGNFRCGQCKHCDNMVRTNSFTDVSSGKIYPIKSFINCNSSYVVYRLECECGCRSNKEEIAFKSG